LKFPGAAGRSPSVEIDEPMDFMAREPTETQFFAAAAAAPLTFRGRSEPPPHGRRVALIVARMTGKWVGVDTATRMAKAADRHG